MTKRQLIFILMLYPILGLAQIADEVNMNLGFYGNSYEIKNKIGFSKTTNAEEISLFVNVNAREHLNELVSYSIGLGISRDYLTFDPFININEINNNELSDYKTLTVAKVANWDWQLQVPISVSFELIDQTDNSSVPIVIPGIRITAGLINKVTINRINTDNIIISEYDEIKGYGYEYYEESLNNEISNYYSGQIGNYRLMMNLGLEFFSKTNTIGFIGGWKYNRLIISPFNTDIKNNFSMIGYLGIYYEINSN